MPKVSINNIAPDFSLKAYDGTDVKLSDFNTKKNVLLVFNRSFL